VIERLEVPPSPERALRDAGLQPSPWSAEPRAHFATHSHARPKRLFVIDGDISFNGEWLHAPAGIRVPAGYEHSADVGAAGVRCVEAFE